MYFKKVKNKFFPSGERLQKKKDIPTLFIITSFIDEGVQKIGSQRLSNNQSHHMDIAFLSPLLYDFFL